MSNLEGDPSDRLVAEMEALAVKVVRGAGEVLARHFGGAIEVRYKDEHGRDPVTAADREAQEYVKRSIAQVYPEHGILAEEDGPEADDGVAPDLVWAVDPLDGTRNFASGLPVFACSVGAVHRGVPLVGAVYLPWPTGGAVLHARRGGGCFVDGVRVEPLRATEPSPGRLVALPAFFMGLFRVREPLRGRVGELRVTGSIAHELAMTARGVFQYTVTLSPSLWDVAAGVVLVVEAGGTVMVGRRRRRLRLLPTVDWQPMRSLVPSWRSGETRMGELRRWSLPLVLGSPDVARQVAAGLRARWLLRRRLARRVRRVVRALVRRRRAPSGGPGR